ncbi:unnamed protein product [marine sediment metagenome]|uniref:Uncharacterized protein n=2 Tax=marine sediment metagenome TaxID=412755 RepID=X0Z7I5_9ZZZZ
MPLYDDQFAGHLFNGDPRNPLSAAFGCTWPTFPAYRYIFDAPNSTGLWAIFRSPAPLVELVSDVNTHRTGEWERIGLPGFFARLEWDKLAIADEFDGFEWVLTWEPIFQPITITNSFIVTSPRACNTDVALPNWNFGEIPGELGEDAFARQVVWDETVPPA